MRVVVVLVVTLWAAALAAGCGSSPATPSPTLTGVDWRLVAFELSDRSVIGIEDPSKFTLHFGADGGLGARADCNVCAGDYRLSGRALSVGPVLCTLIFCGEASHHDRYLRALESAATLRFLGDDLLIGYAEGTLRLRR